MESPPTHALLQHDWPAALMTAAEVAAVLRITPRTVRPHIRRGSLRALRIDGTGPYRIRAEDAQRWAERQAADATGGAAAVDRYALARAGALSDTILASSTTKSFMGPITDEPTRRCVVDLLGAERVADAGRGARSAAKAGAASLQ